jgi:hypothetical protein
MNKLKNLLYQSHGNNKDRLHQLYHDKHIYDSHVRSSDQKIEDEKVFYYKELTLRFRGTGFRTMERLTMIISIPAGIIPSDKPGIDTKCDDMLIYEDYLLRKLAPHINALSEELQNDKKDNREKARFYAQLPSEVILRRSGCVWDHVNKEFKLRLLFYMPLINGITINGKNGFRAIRSLMELIYELLTKLDAKELQLHTDTYNKQQQIRSYLIANNILAFIANGSILPRDGDTICPLKTAIPFLSPDSLKIEIKFDDGTTITGMAIPRGITVITGGGYSGKSTLLDAIEMGIYNHLPGNGREYVITEDSAMKIYAEDGRMVHPLDISPFFSYMPNKQNVHDFHTIHASGSVSQAANIIEAVYAGSKLLLIDEDRSATNFMIRDLTMRRIVKKEPIIPFTDRVRTLSEEHGISTILVIGGSGEYLKYADIVLLMEDYNIVDITQELNALNKEDMGYKADMYIISPDTSAAELPIQLLKTRYLMPQQSLMEFAITKYILIDRTHFIKIDSYITDVTHLTSIISKYQMYALAWILERLLTDENSASDELLKKVTQLSELIKHKDIIETVLSNAYDIEPWFEEVRPLEIVAAVNRMRGITLIKKD